jgi:Flp pilus assembly protein TadB
MAPVIQITRYRAIARRDIPLDVSKGDSDLFPIALFLWICSAARVALTLVHRQTFDVEATLALLCVLGFPLYVLRARYARDTSPK